MFRVGVFCLVFAFFTVVSLAQERRQHLISIPGLSFEVEKRRLDEAAKELELDSNKVVYLVAYNKASRKKSTATNRLNNPEDI